MYSSLTRLASPASTSSRDVGLAAASLLPPLPLYRRLLRAHRSLPNLEMRTLGDTYVKDEFRRHRSIENPLQIVGFLTQWKLYLDGIEKDGQGYKGRKIDTAQFEKLSEEQLYQLHELMTVTRSLFDPAKAESQPPGGQKAVQEAVDDALQKTVEDRKARNGKGK